MKTRIILLICISVLITACSPEVTVTRFAEATVTLTPPSTATVLPTPTLNPQFIALQDQIAASGERFTLLPDGTVQDGATTIPGLQVGAEGKITITVNGEPVEIDPSSMNFDDENGLNIEGFEDTDGDGDWEKLPVFTIDQLRLMTPDQIIEAAPDMPGYEKQYLGFYVHYINASGELGASYNFETGEKLAMPENLQTLEKLPTKIENAESYPEVEVTDLPAFVAWLHYKYDEKAKNLKPYPFVPNINKPGDININGNVAFFQKVGNIDAYTTFLGMIKTMDDGKPLFWGNPRMIRDGQGNLRVLSAADAWGDKMNEPITANKNFTFLTQNPTARGLFQIGQFNTSVSPEIACAKYNKALWLIDRYDGCMRYLKKYYRSVEKEVTNLIDTGIYSEKLEELPIFLSPDVESFYIGG